MQLTVDVEPETAYHVFFSFAGNLGPKSMPAPVPGLSVESFVSAVSRIVGFRDQTIVVKLGGSAMEDPASTDACLKSVATLNHLGVGVVLVHGGGKPIDRAMAASGLTPKKVAGRRYTDDETLAIVVRVLKDEINVEIVARLQDLGCDAIAADSCLYGDRLTIPGPDSQGVDLGRVGKITHVCSDFLTDYTETSRVPVIPSLAIAEDRGWLNVNADTAASAVAGAMKAEKAIFLTDTPGVLRERNDPQSLLPRLTENECRQLISNGIIDGGMMPKVEACFEALEAGAKSALILDGRVPFSLLNVFLQNNFTGTEITR
jgi:acetylglutamate kinase